MVCPASLLGNWEAEIRRFAPGVDVRRFHGGQRSLDDLAPSDAVPDPGFVLTTYGTRPARRRARWPRSPWGLVVADEAQHVKNARSATARALRTVPSAARVALTGTPVENNLTELWAILDWATPGLLGSRQAFRKVWAGPIESGLEPTKARQFAGLIGPFLLRRRKSDPGIAPELPDKTETDHLLGLTREQVVLYESFVRDTMERIERADEDDPARPGAEAADRAQADLQPPGPLPQAVRRPARRALGEARPARRAARHRPRRGAARCWSSPSTSRWPGCSRTT